jgi:hypothetical protein
MNVRRCSVAAQSRKTYVVEQLITDQRKCAIARRRRGHRRDLSAPAHLGGKLGEVHLTADLTARMGPGMDVRVGLPAQ